MKTLSISQVALLALLIVSSPVVAQDATLFGGNAKPGGVFTPGYYISGDGPWGLGGTLGYLSIYKNYDLEQGFEYREGSARSLTAFADLRGYPLKSHRNSDGPFISLGSGIGMAGKDKWRPAVEVRGSLGYNLSLAQHFGMGISGQYRYSYQIPTESSEDGGIEIIKQHVYGVALKIYYRPK